MALRIAARWSSFKPSQYLRSIGVHYGFRNTENCEWVVLPWVSLPLGHLIRHSFILGPEPMASARVETAQWHLRRRIFNLARGNYKGNATVPYKLGPVY